jgi:large subunit ribosomal protein L13
MTKTYYPRSGDITRDWHIFDAKDQILGRLATQIATVLMGKNKASFSRAMDIGDHVVVINASEIAVTGRKEKQKLYHQHSGYPGGMKVTVLEDLRQAHPDRIIIHAVAGMIPDNKLHDRILKHLHVYAGPEHPYTKQFKAND